MATLSMDPTWGALDDQLAPRRRAMLAELLAGRRAVDPAQNTIWGETPKETPLRLEEEPTASPGAPPPAARGPEVIRGALENGGRKGVPTVYDTPYGDQLRKADADVRDSFWGPNKAAARNDQNRLTQLALDWINRSEGRERGENDLAGRVMESVDAGEGDIRKERIARILAGTKRFKRGQVLDRGEEGVWQETLNTETGESEWGEAPIPRKPPAPKPPAFHSLGPNGGIILDSQGRVQRVAAPPRPGGSAPPPAQEPRLPAGVASALVRSVLENIGPTDPEARAQAIAELRSLGVLPGGGGVPETGAPLTPPAPALATATDPRTGRKVQWDGKDWVPVR